MKLRYHLLLDAVMFSAIVGYGLTNPHTTFGLLLTGAWPVSLHWIVYIIYQGAKESRWIK